jgi:hypothetical protein
MRFVELIGERGARSAFEGKYTAALSTSIHYYDHTAHNYVRGVCEDLGMDFVESLSLDMMDLVKEEMRDRLVTFFEHLLHSTNARSATSQHFPPLIFGEFEYEPSPPDPSNRVLVDGQKVLVLTDRYEQDTNLGKMIDRFKSAFSEEIETIDLRDIDIQGACIGCMRCGYDYNCQYNDGFAEFYNERLRIADILVFAGTLQGRYLSSTWKTFYDRGFFWNHTPSLVGKQMAYLVSGPLSQNANLVQILEASTEARQYSNHVDIITDECEDSLLLDALLDGLAERLIRYSKERYVKPQNFLGVGGHKIFRDDVWGRLRPIWQADHRHYRRHGFYDFPQKNLKVRVTRSLMMMLTSIPAFRRKFYENVKTGPSKRFGRLIDQLSQD